MKKILLVCTPLILILVSFVFGILLSKKPLTSLSQPAIIPSRRTSPDKADLLSYKLTQATQYLSLHPSKPESYTRLATVYLQMARESGDFSLNGKAEQAIEQALQFDSENLEALRLKAQLLITYHKFHEGVELGRKVQQRQPDTPDIYGVLTDGLVELGEYKQAIQMAQTMMDLRPDGASYARTAYLRHLHGDTQGAIEAMGEAIRATPHQNREAKAWHRVHLGNYLLNVGQLSAALEQYELALQSLPNYHLALAAKAHILEVQGELKQAEQLYQQAQNRVPSLVCALALGNIYTRLGQPQLAEQQYQLAEFLDQGLKTQDPMVSREVALSLADRGQKLDLAFQSMQREITWRNDIFTWDALAWCALKANQPDLAERAMTQALRLGTKDRSLLLHASHIYERVGKPELASQYQKQAQQLPYSTLRQ